MRQIVLTKPGHFVDIHAPVPSAGEGEVLVRIRRVGICGSDFHAFNGVHPAYTYPRVIGHEIACEVVEVPEDENGLRPGDACAVEPYINCGGCRACLLNRPNCCENLQLFGVHVDGGMQAYLAVPLRLLHQSKVLSLDQLALVETLGIGANAVARAGLKKGETALVIGGGPIGLAVTQFALAMAASVRLVELNGIRREFASRFGIEVLPEANGQLADVVFDATGNAHAMSRSLQQVGAGGRLVFVGVCRDMVQLDDPLFHKREVTMYASRNSCHQFPRVIGMVERGEIDTKPWINARLHLNEVPDCFPALAQRPDLIKAVIEIDDGDAE